jgi:hypothetical protein
VREIRTLRATGGGWKRRGRSGRAGHSPERGETAMARKTSQDLRLHRASPRPYRATASASPRRAALRVSCLRASRSPQPPAPRRAARSRGLHPHPSDSGSASAPRSPPSPPSPPAHRQPRAPDNNPPRATALAPARRWPCGGHAPVQTAHQLGLGALGCAEADGACVSDDYYGTRCRSGAFDATTLHVNNGNEPEYLGRGLCPGWCTAAPCGGARGASLGASPPRAPGSRPRNVCTAPARHMARAAGRRGKALGT